MRHRERLLIIGAGPKALAIAAKNEVLADLGLRVPQVHIVERHVVGAHWTGRHGYTNGKGVLGTLPDKDLGFPYQSDRWGERLNRLVDDRMRHYSWNHYLIARRSFSDWIDRGRPAPEHRQWADYLQWVAASLGPNTRIDIGEVTSVAMHGGRWRLRYRDPQARPREVDGDGLVITGPGRPRWPCALPESSRLLSTESFWSSPHTIGQQPHARVAIIGTGETAAAVALHLIESHNSELHIDIICPSGMIYSRGESYRENYVYSNPARGHWHTLSLGDRRQFILRTDRGVFSSHAQSILNQAINIDLVPGRVRSIVELPDSLEMELEYEGRCLRSSYDYVVVAMGLDQLPFLRGLLDGEVTQEILAQTSLADLEGETVEACIGSHLELVGLHPRLHLPALAGMLQGPGFANLSCLGRLSDLILAAYIDAVDQREIPDSQPSEVERLPMVVAPSTAMAQPSRPLEIGRAD
jgi:mycobactin lysine-N-oxygenase